MKAFTAQRTCNCPIGADQPEIETQLLCDRQGKFVPPSRDQDDFYAFNVSTAQCPHIGLGNLVLRIEQGSVNVDG